VDEFILQPALYGTGGHDDLFSLLDKTWLQPGEASYLGGTYFLVSGFGNHNGGVRFFERFRHHIDAGGRVRAIFGGSKSMNLTSRQLVEALIDCGVEVTIVNRSRILHAKLYGTREPDGQQCLVTTSGNFTWPGLKQNVESVMSLGRETTATLGFSWDDVFDALVASSTSTYDLVGATESDPAWALLYDETAGRGFKAVLVDQETEEPMSMVQTLGHMDTVRINAAVGTTASRGSQYFFLSKDTYDYFPPLTIRNKKGQKATYSADIEINFRDLSQTRECRVTFEADNNLDFRLGTGPLRNTSAAADGDMMILTRTGEATYDLRIVRQGTNEFIILNGFALSHIGHVGKRYGYAPTERIVKLLGA